MTKTEAIELLKHHSFTHENINHPKTQNGFLGMLRPFKGKIYEENYHDVVKAIKVLADDYRDQKVIRKEIISTVWNICHLARAWGIYPDGPLRSNNLISAECVKQLEEWIDDISYIVTCLLDDCDIPTAFEFYNEKYK